MGAKNFVDPTKRSGMNAENDRLRATTNKDAIDPVDFRLPGLTLPSVDVCDYL